MKYVNNTKGKIKVQTRDTSIGWKTLYKDDVVEAFDRAYADSYEKAGLTLVEEVEVKEVKEIKEVKKVGKNKVFFGVI